MDVHRYLLDLVVLDVDDEAVLEPAAGVVEHRYQYLLALLLVQRSTRWLAQHANAFIVAKVHLLRAVKCLAPDESLPHL